MGSIDPIEPCHASSNTRLNTPPLTSNSPPLPFSWPRNGAPGLRARHGFPPLLTMIRGVVSPGPEALTDR